MAAGSRPQLVFVDDDRVQLDAVRTIVERSLGFEVFTFDDRGVKEAMRHIANFPPDLIILDQHISNTVLGTELLVEIRKIERSASVIFLSADPDVTLRVEALNRSADAFLRKPYEPDELIALIKATLRRVTRSTDTRAVGEAKIDGPPFEFAGVTILPGTMTATFGGQSLPLTPQQLGVVVALYNRRGRITTRAELTNEVWRARYSAKSRVLDQTVYELRAAFRTLGLEPPCGIASVRGVGYHEAGTLPARPRS